MVVNGARIWLSLPEGARADVLKAAIQEATGIPSGEQVLSQGGRALVDRAALGSQPVRVGLRLVGGGGKKGKGRPKGTRNAGLAAERRELLFRDEGQEYARVLQMLGNRRCRVECLDGQIRTAIIRGSMRRGSINRVRNGDFVLVGLRDFQEDKCDVLHLYQSDEVLRLKGYQELPAGVKLGGDQFGVDEEDDGLVEFGLESDDDNQPIDLASI